MNSEKPLEPSPGLLLKRQDIAKRFGVSVSTVTRWARLGLIKAVRTPGGHYRFPVDDIGSQR